MRLFRQTYRDRHGEQRTASRWYLEWRDNGRVRHLAGFTSKSATAELARRIEQLRAGAVVNVGPDADLARFLECLPQDVRARLVDFGLIESRNVAAGKPLSEHLDDFEAALLARGNTPRHATLTTQRVRRVIDGCRCQFWSDLSASKIQRCIADLGTGPGGISAQTRNYYLASVKAFCRWAVRDGRASESPVEHLRAVNARADRRHERRALSVDELRRLIDAAERGPVRSGIPGPERAMLYRVAVETGLRAGELRSLTRASFALEGSEPTVAAAYSKRRREDVLPLRPETARTLGVFLSGKMPAARALAMPSPSEVSRMLRADLGAARDAWLG